jgi:hypothetical protein
VRIRHLFGGRITSKMWRSALGLMGSTPNIYLAVLSGILPLAERFAYLNFIYLVAAFYRLGHLLRERLGMLGTLNMGRCIKGYFDVLSLDMIPSESFTRHELPALLGTPLVDRHMGVFTAELSALFYHVHTCSFSQKIINGLSTSAMDAPRESSVRTCQKLTWRRLLCFLIFFHQATDLHRHRILTHWIILLGITVWPNLVAQNT